MALLNIKNNQYIKLLADGSFIIYRSEESRNKHKYATDSSIILNKYAELSKDIEDQILAVLIKHGYSADALYDEALALTLMGLPGMEDLVKSLKLIYQELSQYTEDLQIGKGASSTYLIMSEFYPDVADSIPEILEAAGCYWHANTLEDMYEEAKVTHRFGNTKDC
jgi:hypothetical protein